MTTETEGLPELASRVARLEGAYERVDRQLESLDRRYEGLVHTIDQLRTDMTGQIDNVNGRIDALRSDMTGQIESLRSETPDIDALRKKPWMTMIAVITFNIAAVSIAVALLR